MYLFIYLLTCLFSYVLLLTLCKSINYSGRDLKRRLHNPKSSAPYPTINSHFHQKKSLIRVTNNDNKKTLDEVFVISRIMKAEVGVI